MAPKPPPTSNSPSVLEVGGGLLATSATDGNRFLFTSAVNLLIDKVKIVFYLKDEIFEE